jgi:HSP20 family protein
VTLLSLLSSADAGTIRQDIQDLFDDLAATLSDAERGGAGECHPSVDVLETDETIEIFVDAAGVPPHALRVAFRNDVIVVVGEKAPLLPQGPRTFHLVEREFGRFARAVRVPGAFDIGAARARVRDGELQIMLPKRADRRGRTYRIPVSGPTSQATE